MVEKFDESADPARTMRIDIPPEDMLRLQAVRHRSLAPRERPAARPRGNDAYERLLECIYDAVLITDVSGIVVDWNARVGEFFLLPEDRLRGLSVLSLISGADASLLDSIRHNLDEHRYTLIEARCTRWEGPQFPAEIAVSGWKVGRQERLCFFVRDITVRRQAFDALESAVKRLKDYDQARTEFVSNVSHELRTPLTSMLYAINNMLRGVLGKLPDAVTRYLERLNSDCRRLLMTVNDILDIRQIENQTLTLARTRVPLVELVRGSLDSIRVQAEEKGIALSFTVPDRAFFAHCDPRRMERVFINVLGNAVKFTPSGGNIVVTVAEDPREPTRALISFCDTGIGIPAEAVHKVTLRYFKVGDQPIGSGLGLAIAKEIVEMHEGDLSIQSPVPDTGGGTMVQVRLPMLCRTMVLLVDGTGNVESQIRALMTSRGFSLRVVRTGAAALEHLLFESAGSRSPDVVQPPLAHGAPPPEPVDALITTLSLPDMQGTDLLLRIKHHPRASRLPMLALSEAPLSPSRREVLHGLGIPVLTDPWATERLVEALNKTFYARTGFTV